jgi:putative ABC transport system ATP-binding protein
LFDAPRINHEWSEKNMTETMIRARHLHKNFHMGEVVVHAIQDVTIEARPGEFIAIMGPSGSGKSTLLHLLAGLEDPTTGEIELGDQAYLQLSDRELTLLRRRKIGVVFQFFNLLPNLTALENIALPLLLDGQSMRNCRVQARQALIWVGLEDRGEHTPDRLSGGEQQRAALARALVYQPELLLADEPTGNLDRAAGERMLKLLRKAADEKRQTIMMVTHDAVAASWADRVVFLSDGRLIDEIKGKCLTLEAISIAQAHLEG